MIPLFTNITGTPWPVLPPGIHDSTLDEVFTRYAINEKRRKLFDGMDKGLKHLFEIGCQQIFLDGSYVTEKPLPNDYEICWDMRFVNADLLDPVFMDFSLERLKQKEKYGGEYFPDLWTEANSGMPFLDFFQTDKDTGKRKGIIRISNYSPKKRG